MSSEVVTPQGRVRPFAVSLRLVFAIAVPMTLAHMTTPLIGITDMAVIGQLGDRVLIGAVGLGAVLFDFLGTSFNFLRMGTTGLVAQAMGREDREGEALTLWRALAIALGAGIVIVAVHGPMTTLFLLAMGASDGVSSVTREYVAVRIFAIPPMLMNYAILGWLLGLARARTGLILQSILALTNIALSVAFVLVLDYGVVGVAVASVLSELLALAIGAAIVVRSLREAPRPSTARIFERVGFVRMLVINADILIRSILLVGAFSFFAAVSARLGDLTLAANAILMNLVLLNAYVLDGLATAAEQLGGRAVGANYRAAFDRTIRLTLGAGLVICTLLTGLNALLGPSFIAMMTTAPEVRAESLAYLLWAAMTPLAGMVAFVMDGLFIGATWTRTMRDMMVVSTLAFVLIWWLATPWLANHGVWLALIAYFVIRGATLWAFVPRLSARTFDGSPASPPR